MANVDFAGIAVDTEQKITHVLDRLCLGPRPGDRQKVQRLGIEGYIQAQLNPNPASDPATLRNRLAEFPALNLSPVELFEQYTPGKNPSEARRQAANKKQSALVRETTYARLLRAIMSPCQLQELMTDFWFNHFNVYLSKGITKLWVGVYEQTALRPHALGKFRNLLGATAKHPAMSFYLDNWRNTDPNSDQARGPYKGLNENYARELLELHTLGVNGGYSQADVESLTRILTGWGLVREQTRNHDGSGFRFEPARHDGDNKTLLGETILGGGLEEGESALDLLAQHPSTARHISYKLAEYFVSDVPPEGLVSSLADRFLATDGDIKAVLRTLFESDEFWSDAYYQNKFKTPYQHVISLFRATGIAPPPEDILQRIAGALNQLGMPLYRCSTPNGYDQIEAAWLNADAVIRRVGFARAAVNLTKKTSGEQPEASALKATLGDQFSAQTLSVVDSSPQGIRAALLLGSPEMMYR
ncbi:MAG: DUF1800 domain-containing protein [Cyanobacteria bacterium J06598_1]